MQFESDHKGHLRPNIAQDLAVVVSNMIFRGELGEGQRINEVHLAKQLEISRTPLREALTALVGEGLIVAYPRRGYFVRPLTTEEVRQIYPIRPLFDVEALRLSGLPTPAQLKELHALNDRILAEPSAIRRVDLDDAWHLQLVANCPNALLIDLIRQFMRRTRRYELAYLNSESGTAQLKDEHAKILQALERRDLAAACDALRINLSTSEGAMCAWLESRQKGNTP